ncbi:MAG: NAD-dependent epimerase/dehydratase family protein [Planctomycetes bacterium]|nr:NAD-dependent epimerase/dehydratase family protein [Planctomycetota bacterium]
MIVTGAAGCVGRALVKRLSSDGLVVVGIGRSEPEGGSDLVVAEWHSRDLLQSGLDDLTEDCEGLIHLAALVHAPGTESWGDYRAANVGVTRRLLEGWKRTGGVPRRFVFASTVAVYGSEVDLQADEATKCAPRTMYARSKFEAEKVVLDAGGTVVRFPVVYGPGDRGNVALLIDAIARGRFVLPSRCAAPRSMLASENAAHGILLALRTRSDARLFLITDDDDVGLERLARAIAQSVKSPIRLRVVPRGLVWLGACAGSALGVLGVGFPLSLERWRKLTQPLTFSCKRASTELAYTPPVSFEEGIRAAVRAFGR